ncbi:MAG: DUF4926 domain-containing protein [Anaerolineae bacterium]|nr:DUF4926 domain-containing protein [Anaerolineae bacterium]
MKRGDVAWLIDIVHDPVAKVDGYVLEVFNILGESVRIATVPVNAVEPLRAEHLPAVRLPEPVR